ncbi:MAG: hypothetical protein QGG40_02865 [Myxococcota bacterium]|jgi:hypothetical protein|nr:hypothetical protein [Myxococcota bacterium]
MRPLPRLFPASLLFGSVVLTGCGPAEEADPCVSGDEPTLEVGKGELEYQDMGAEDGTAELIHGPQGGYHLNIALQGSFLDASAPLEAELTGWIDGEEVGHTLPYATMRCNQAAGALQAWGLLLIWDAEPEALHEKTTTVEVELTDASGETISASSDVVIWDPSLE